MTDRGRDFNPSLLRMYKMYGVDMIAGVRKIRVIVLFVFCGLVIVPQSIMCTERYAGPMNLGPVHFDKGIWNDAEPFFKKYGKGKADEGKFPSYQYVTSLGVYVHIERYHGENKPINQIVISYLPYSTMGFEKPKIDFGPLVTEDGIGLGSSIQDVVDVYGQPDAVCGQGCIPKAYVPELWKQEYGEGLSSYLYHAVQDCLWSRFYFFNGEVVGMIVSTAC